MRGIVGDCNKSLLQRQTYARDQPFLIYEHLRTTRLASLRQTVKIASIQAVKILHPFKPSKFCFHSNRQNSTYLHSLRRNSRHSFQVPIMDAQSDLKVEGVDCNNSSVPLILSVCNSWHPDAISVVTSQIKEITEVAQNTNRTHPKLNTSEEFSNCLLSNTNKYSNTFLCHNTCGEERKFINCCLISQR